VLFAWFAVVANVTLPLKLPLPVGANVIADRRRSRVSGV
jgi:hypothetical protein